MGEILPHHAESPEVAVQDALDGPVQVGPVGTIVTSPVEAVLAGTKAGGPAGHATVACVRHV